MAHLQRMYAAPIESFPCLLHPYLCPSPWRDQWTIFRMEVTDSELTNSELMDSELMDSELTDSELTDSELTDSLHSVLIDSQGFEESFGSLNWGQ